MTQASFKLFELPVKRSRRRRLAAAKPKLRVVTLLTPLHVEDGVFPSIHKRVTRLKDSALRCARWPKELRFDGAPFGTADIVYRRAGRWVVAPPAWQGECPYIQAAVQRLVFPEEQS